MMRILVLVNCTVVMLALSGCQGLNGGGKGVEVIVDGDGEFPAFLAGTWRSDKKNCFWEFVFEPDGRISSLVTNLGAVRMKPGKAVRFPTRGGGKGIFEPGPWLVRYSPDTRELMVKVVIEHFYIDMGKSALEGNSTDILIGPVSEDGRIWWAEWFSSQTYIGHIPELKEPEKFEDVIEPVSRGSLIFEKVE